jgi:hypothetical protein
MKRLLRSVQDALTMVAVIAATFITLHFALGARAAYAVQVVYPSIDAMGTKYAGVGLPNSWKTTKSAGSTFTFFGRYVSTNKREAGVGLKIFFDPNKLSIVIDQVVGKCLLAEPATSGSNITMAWLDLDIGWPGGMDNCPLSNSHAALPVPVNLFRVTVTLAPSFTSGTTTVAFTGTGAPELFTSTLLVITGAP